MNAPKHLPIATTFCAATLPLFDGLEFFLDGNSKITRENGTYANPKPNAFSLPAASVDPQSGACPGSTETCRSSCYVKGLAAHAPDLYAKYQANADALQVCLPSERGFYLSALKLAMWIEENAPGGFRWHVSGDVLSVRHAEWIVEVCMLAPSVPFWIYTRTLDAVGALSRTINLAVNVSADADNYAEARRVAGAWGARLCYLTGPTEHAWVPFHENAPRWCARCGQYSDDQGGPAPFACLPPLPEGSVIFPDYPVRKQKGSDWFDTLSPEHRKMICPTDMYGQSEAHRCGSCRKCF